MAKIKICGLKRPEDISYVNKLSPDYVGFVLSNGYKRSIDMAQLRKLRDKLNSNIKAVGVFVNEPVDIVNACIKMELIDMVQLHGNEDVEYIKQIKAPVIKALKPSEFNLVKDYKAYVDYFLFDSGTGTGKSFDWSTIPKTDTEFFLAGGIGSNNLREAIGTVKPYAVDLSSSVETDGYKDYYKIKEVIEIVRSTQ
ncbi:MAG: phosphoribosylanthranilate isomerase [Eubacterium sp.]